ncbi:hypothetical protein Peur_050657 [Populus x canadensis]
MRDLQIVKGIKTFNNQNYKVVNGSEDTQLAKDMNGGLCRWKIKVGKEMFALKTTIEKNMLEHIQDTTMLKEA